ncbi:hypothetical protein D3C76_1357190 [compost metagenome]
MLQVVDGHRLDDFQVQQRRVHRRVRCQQLLQALGKVIALQMPRGDIHAQRPGLPLALPGLQLAQRLPDHPLADFDDQVGLLYPGQEIARRHHTTAWPLPAQ